MSPEQFSTEDSLTPPSDIYALGGLLYYFDRPRAGSCGGGCREPTAGNPAAAAESTATSTGSAVGRWRRAGTDLLGGRLAEYRARLARAHLAGTLAGSQAAALGPAALVGGATTGSSSPPARGRVFQYNGARTGSGPGARNAVASQTNRFGKTNARVRKHRYFVRSIVSSGRGRPSQILPTLVDSVAGRISGAQRDGTLPAIMTSPCFASWHSPAPAGARHLDTLLVKFALAQLLLSEGDSVESAALLDDLDATLLPRLAEDDPTRLALAAFRVCAQANSALTQGAAPDGIVAPLRAQEAALAHSKHTDGARRLVSRLLHRCQAAQASAGGE